ncbi:MAG: hypothetical protein Kow0037_19110 [Calditrichia bacterium]
MKIISGGYYMKRNVTSLIVVAIVVLVMGFVLPTMAQSVDGKPQGGVTEATLLISGDANGNGQADPGERLTLGGSGFAGVVPSSVEFLEFSDAAGTVQVNSSTPSYLIRFVGGEVRGYVFAPASFDPSAVSIRIRVTDGSSNTATSQVYAIADNTPPQLSTGAATGLSTIRIVFSEAVQEVGGDAAPRFLLTGSDASGLSVISVDPVEAPPTTIWDLTLSGNLADRDPDNVVVTYDQTSSSTAPQIQDAAGNQVAAGSNVTVTDQIAPAAPTMSAPTASSDFSGGSVKWIATADDITTDPSIAYLQLQGSDDLSNWTFVGPQDNSTSSTSYSGTYTYGTQYAYYRVAAVDDQGNESYSSPSVNYQNAQRIRITSAVVNQPVNTYEDRIDFEIVDAYGNLENITDVLNLAMTSGTGTGTFRLTPGGSNITSISLTNQNSGSFYFACTATGTKTISIINASLVDANQSAVITAGSAAKILVRLPGQSFANGTGITGTPNAQTAGSSFNVYLYIVDNNNYLALGEDSPRNIDFTLTANSSPNGDAPTINGQTSANWANMSISFTNGISQAIPVVLYREEGNVTLTASDDAGSPNLSGEQSSAITVNNAGLNNFNFSLASPQTDGFPVSGTNTLTAVDAYGNVITDFDASAQPVTLAKNSGTGTLSVFGLHGTGEVLNQASDFVSGVANLTNLGMRLDVSQPGVYQLKAVVGGSDKGASGDVTINARQVAVSSPSPSADANIDAGSGNSDLTLSATLSGGEETLYNYNDDFQIKWGFSDNADGSNLQATGASGNLTVSGGVSHTVPAATLQGGSAYAYMFWWVENVNTTGNSTTLTGAPISSNMNRLIVNPTLATSGGDASSGGFTPGTQNQEMVYLQFTTSPATATVQITGIDAVKSGSATGSDVDAFHLYKDNGTVGVFDGADQLLASAGYSGGSSVSFSGFTLDVTGGPVNVLITVDINSSANTSATLGLTIADESAITVADNVVNGGASAIQKQAFTNIGTQGDNPLPVSLISFTAEPGKESIRLKWATASEIDNAGFFIFRKTEEQNSFEQLNVQIIPGQGYSTTTNEYEYEDRNVVPGMTYYYKLVSRDFDGTVHTYNTIEATLLNLPEKFALEPNFPNPFNPATRIRFTLPENATVTLEVFNILGQKVRTLLSNEKLEAGTYDQLQWDATDDLGQKQPSGIYYIVMSVKEHNFKQVQRAVYLR